MLLHLLGSDCPHYPVYPVGQRFHTIILSELTRSFDTLPRPPYTHVAGIMSAVGPWKGALFSAGLGGTLPPKGRSNSCISEALVDRTEA